MRLTVLGSSGTYTTAGSVCSGYLIRTATTTVMVDAGNGSSANLQAEVDLTDLDAIVISHQHADHCVDLIGLHHAVRARGDGATGIPLYSPPGVIDLLTELTSREAPYVFEDSFDLQGVQAGDSFTVGDIRFRLFAAIHPVPTLSMRIEAEGRVLTYSADSAGGPVLVEAATGADLFLCEATWQGEQLDHPSGIHLTAYDAGDVATAAGVGRLMLTHIAGNLDRDVSLAQARTRFDGPIDLAYDRLTVEV
jgi:ribonuclease BN (tRNA processing enzyme)